MLIMITGLSVHRVEIKNDCDSQGLFYSEVLSLEVI